MSSPRAKLVYVLERFPADTLNFVYNEIRVLEEAGFEVDIFSLLPAEDCPQEAAAFVARTRNVRPVGLAGILGAITYFLFRSPLRLASLFLTLPLENSQGRLRKVFKTWAHLIHGVCFAWLLRDTREHIHAHFAFKAATAALVASRLNRTSFSFTAHGSATVFPPSRYSLRSKIRAARFIIAVSRFNKETMLGLCPDVDADRIFVNRTGILLDQFPLREPEQHPEGRFRILCVASLYPIKNHEGLIRACGLLARESRDFELVLIGKDDYDRMPALEALARSLGIQDRVVFRGSVDHGQVARELKMANVGILTSFSEGIPVALMEAMACGLPVVGPRVTGVAELVEDGVSGYLVDPHSEREIAEALARIQDDAGLAAGLGLAGRSRVEQEFDMRANARRLAGFFQEQLVNRGAEHG